MSANDLDQSTCAGSYASLVVRGHSLNASGSIFVG